MFNYIIIMYYYEYSLDNIKYWFNSYNWKSYEYLCLLISLVLWEIIYIKLVKIK